MINIREFRLPSDETRAKMSTKELIEARDLFNEWILMHEEAMAFNDYDKQMDRMRSLEDYIEMRLKGE